MSRWADVPDSWQQELSDETLLDCAGKTIFARGVEYFEQGQVTLARDGGGNATFKVQGTQTYSTELYFEDVGLHSDCTCPHAQDGHFCKHMVAAALLWRQHLGGEVAVPPRKVKSATAERAAQTKARKRDDLKTFVETQSAAALAERLWAWAERDRELMADLKAWAATAQAHDDPKLLNKALDELLKSNRDFLDVRDTSAYFQRARKALPVIEAALARDPAQGRAAAEHALKRLYRVALHADDSNGPIGDLITDCMRVVQQSLAAAPPSADWADTFLQLVEADPYGIWHVNDVLDAAGHEVSRRWSKLLVQRWEKFEAGQGRGDAKKEVSWGTGGTLTEADMERRFLRRECLADLERQQDVAALIAFARRTASGDWDHDEVVRLCEKHGRWREALAAAQAAHKANPKSHLAEETLLRCYERDGWDNEAFALRKQRFWNHTRPEEWRALLKVAQAAKQDLDALRREAEAMLLARESRPAPTRGWLQSHQREAGPVVSQRVQWLLLEDRALDALTALQAPNACHPTLLLELSTRLDAKHDAQAFALCDRVARHLMAQSNGRYDDVIDAVRMACKRLDKTEARRYVEQLRIDFKAKRNFTKALGNVLDP